MMRWVFAGVLAGGLSLSLVGCDNESELACVPESMLECGGEVRRSTLDTGEGFDLDPGVGVGVFVEYESDGRYRVSTTCDSVHTGYACYFDILLSAVEGEILGLEAEDLEDDGLDWLDDDFVSFRSETDYDADSAIILVEPGTVLSVDVLLDCSCGNPYLFWVGDGAIHSGSPSNPLELVPSAP